MDWQSQLRFGRMTIEEEITDRQWVKMIFVSWLYLLVYWIGATHLVGLFHCLFYKWNGATHLTCCHITFLAALLRFICRKHITRDIEVRSTDSYLHHRHSVGFHKFNNLIDVSECHAHTGICRTVINGHFIPFREGCTRENHIRHIACKFYKWYGATHLMCCQIIFLAA